MGMGQTEAAGRYERKIKYLDYMENGTRMKGAGFVRLERWDGQCSFHVQVTGLYRKDHFTRPFLLLGQEGETELCKLQFADGGVKTELEDLDIRDLDGQGLRYESVVGFRIPVSEGKEISCIWGNPDVISEPWTEKEAEKAPQEPMEEEAEQTDKPENQTEEEKVPREESSEEEKEQRQEPVEQPGKQTEEEKVPPEESAEEEKEQRQEQAKQPGNQTEERQETGTEPEEGPAEQESSPAPLMREDKWEQLSTVYPHIYPFHDDREYLSMGPGDFVIFPGKYYKLVSNSFLLHGYYNYDHLILARVEQRGIPKYYIGVPGNYFEREKKVAVLFGFVSFESDREPAEEGDFGYYMIPVEL